MHTLIKFHFKSAFKTNRISTAYSAFQANCRLGYDLSITFGIGAMFSYQMKCGATNKSNNLATNVPFCSRIGLDTVLSHELPEPFSNHAINYDVYGRVEHNQEVGKGDQAEKPRRRHERIRAHLHFARECHFENAQEYSEKKIRVMNL